MTDRTRRSRPRAITEFVVFAPFLAVFVAAIVAPLLYALGLSLFRRRLIGGTTFVGLDAGPQGAELQRLLDLRDNPPGRRHAPPFLDSELHDPPSNN